MKAATLDLLACPGCHECLDYAGLLTCSHFKQEYPIVDGIPHGIEPEAPTDFNRRFARMYNWFSWIYSLFSKVAFAYICMDQATGRREITDQLEPRGELGRAYSTKRTMTSDRCAKIVRNALCQRCREVLMGPGILTIWLKTFAPGFLDWLTIKVFLEPAIRCFRVGKIEV